MAATVTRAATMVAGGMVSIATLISVNEPPQISASSVRSAISSARFIFRVPEPDFVLAVSNIELFIMIDPV